MCGVSALAHLIQTKQSTISSWKDVKNRCSAVRVLYVCADEVQVAVKKTADKKHLFVLSDGGKEKRQANMCDPPPPLFLFSWLNSWPLICSPDGHRRVGKASSWSPGRQRYLSSVVCIFEKEAKKPKTVMSTSWAFLTVWWFDDWDPRWAHKYSIEAIGRQKTWWQHPSVVRKKLNWNMFWLNFSGSNFLKTFAHSVHILLRRRSENKHWTSEQECENKKWLAQVKANVLAFSLLSSYCLKKPNRSVLLLSWL